MKERYFRPTIAFADAGDGLLKGSGRSVPSVADRPTTRTARARAPGAAPRRGGALLEERELAVIHVGRFRGSPDLLLGGHRAVGQPIGRPRTGRCARLGRARLYCHGAGLGAMADGNRSLRRAGGRLLPVAVAIPARAAAVHAPGAAGDGQSSPLRVLIGGTAASVALAIAPVGAYLAVSGEWSDPAGALFALAGTMTLLAVVLAVTVSIPAAATR